MEEPKILILGNDRDYYAINTDEEFLRKTIPGIEDKNKTLLYHLRDEDSRKPAAVIRMYSGEYRFTTFTTSGENAIDGLIKLFGQVKDFASKHNAHYALVQNLDIIDRATDLSLSAYLMIDD
ncbi:hypothetical protein KY332_00630 [Candidatus Woesearchaeota archaeon]|nr:hypothetical protein [Candidatus Woesearchaeota archaeon]